jgi:hypothetical protein
MENKVLKILGDKKLTISQLAKVYYRGSKGPVNPNNTVSGIVLRINRKVEYHNLSWFIKSAGLGRHGKTVWVTKQA